jgi:hypothetical protein
MASKQKSTQKFKTVSVEDTELVYTLLREKFPENEVQVEYNHNTKEYTLEVSDKKYMKDPEIPLDVKIKVVYGDSVTGCQPLLLRDPHTGLVHIETIQSIGEQWNEYPEFKINDKSVRLEKQYSKTHYEVWTDKGWSKINKVIKHKTNKKIYKVLTHCGLVKVTEDHSLLDEKCQVLKPKECDNNTRLLSSYPMTFESKINTISKNRAFIYGFFFGDGSCGRYECNSGVKYSWALNNADLDVLYNLQKLMEKEYTGLKTTVDDTIESSGVYKLRGNAPKDFVNEYRQKFYDSEKYKKVPVEILNSSNDVIESFFSGYWASDGCRKDKETIGCTRFDIKGNIGSAGMYFLMKKLGFNVSLNTRNDKEKIVRLTVTKKKQRKISNQIKKISVQDLEEDQFVYDLETEIGRFNAGVGDLQLKNTDSVFLSMKYNLQDFETNRKDTFKLAIVCGDNLTKEIFKRPPIELEFEKVYQPFILLTKKRYIGKKFEDTRDPMKLKTLTTSGIAITRRDYSYFVKKCYKEVIDSIMDNSLEQSLEIFRKYIEMIENYQVDFDDLIVSSTLAKSYSCSLCKEKCEWNRLMCSKPGCKENNVVERKENCKKCKTKFKCLHTFNLGPVALAVKMLQRNEEINVNDRIQYLLVEREGSDGSKKAELAEDPKYAKEHNLKFNRICYLEQLAKPLLGFFKTVLKEDQDTLDDIISFVNYKLVNFGGKKLKVSDFKINEDA